MNVGKITDASRLLKISKSKGYQLAKDGRLPGTFRLEGTTIIRVDLDQLADWIRAQSADEAEAAL